MSQILIQNSMLSASEFALSIALTVFIIITVILALLLIFLAASKNFRTVFFREKQKRKSGKKKNQSAALSEPSAQDIDTMPAEQVVKSRKAATKRTETQPEYLSAIPTVPLGGMPAPEQPRARSRANRRAQTEDTLEALENGSTYTMRSITITRAHAPKSSQAKEQPSTPRNDKKR